MWWMRPEEQGLTMRSFHAFDPQIIQDMQHAVRQLKNERNDRGVTVLEINLYDLVIEILQREGDWDWIVENEPTLSRDELKGELQGILDTEKALIPEIVKKMRDASYDVIFITGVGEVFPYIRSHTILNNLQRVAKEQPTLMFFRQCQHTLETGASLRLFDNIDEQRIQHTRSGQLN